MLNNTFVSLNNQSRNTWRDCTNSNFDIQCHVRLAVESFTHEIPCHIPNLNDFRECHQFHDLHKIIICWRTPWKSTFPIAGWASFGSGGKIRIWRKDTAGSEWVNNEDQTRLWFRVGQQGQGWASNVYLGERDKCSPQQRSGGPGEPFKRSRRTTATVS